MKDMIAWSEGLGMEWEPGWIDGEQKVAMCLAPKGSQESGNSYRMLSVAEDFYNDVFVANGGEYLFGTAITGLVMEDGRVVGVQATPKDGDPLLVKANKGVILATGGMCNNIEMLKRYCPSGLYRCMVSNASTNDNGDGIRLGFGAGAQFDGYNNHGHFDGGIEGVDWNHMLYAADIQIARQPWLQIDTRGTRVAYDISAYEDTGARIMAMPESKVFSFFDANWEEYCEGFVLPMCRNLTRPDMANQERWNGTLDPDYRNGVNEAISEGRIKQGNTPEEACRGSRHRARAGGERLRGMERHGGFGRRQRLWLPARMAASAGHPALLRASARRDDVLDPRQPFGRREPAGRRQGRTRHSRPVRRRADLGATGDLRVRRRRLCRRFGLQRG